MGTVMSIISHYSESTHNGESTHNTEKYNYNGENIYNNNSDNIYMGNVLSKMRKTMEESLLTIKRRMNRDRRAEQIYKEIRQKDYIEPNTDLDSNYII
jgi:hypothetical protein